MVARLNRERPLPSPSEPRVADSGLQRALSELFVALRAVVSFLQPFAQPQPWRLAPLSSTWADLTNTPTFSRASYRKDPMGRVHLRGVVKRTGAGDDIFQLPEGLRPPLNLVFVVSSNSLGARLDVNSSGQVSYVSGGDPTVYVSLSGISFDTEE